MSNAKVLRVNMILRSKCQECKKDPICSAVFLMESSLNLLGQLMSTVEITCLYFRPKEKLRIS